jgi:hypothetical protein
MALEQSLGLKSDLQPSAYTEEAILSNHFFANQGAISKREVRVLQPVNRKKNLKNLKKT